MLSDKLLKPIQNLKKEIESLIDEKNISKVHAKLSSQLQKVKLDIKKEIDLNMSQDFKPLKTKIQKQKQEVDNMIKDLIQDEIQKAQDFLNQKKKDLKKMQVGIEKYIHNELKILNQQAKPSSNSTKPAVKKTKSASKSVAKSSAKSIASKKISKKKVLTKKVSKKKAKKT